MSNEEQESLHNIEDLSNSGQFVVALRGPSAARIVQDESWAVLGFPTAFGTCDVIFRTRYIDAGFSAPIPRELWAEVRGSAPSLESAIPAFGGAAYSLVPIIALSSNAAVGELEVELAYDNTPGISKRRFFQQFLLDEQGIPRNKRIVNTVATGAVLQAITQHAESERIHRAAAQYQTALSHWTRGHETLALAHLYMGMEALTKAAIRTRLRKDGLSEADLVAQLGIQNWEEMGKEKRETTLGAAFRRLILFNGDSDCYNKAKKASDGFEHGFLSLNEIRNLSRDIQDRAAAYLRSALLEVAGVEPAVTQLLFSSPFDKPHSLQPFTKYIWGHLLGTSEELAEQGQQYPILRWESSVKSFSLLDSGIYKTETNEHLMASLGKGITFQPARFEVWQDSPEARQNENE